MKKVLFSLAAMLLLSVSGFAQTTYTKVTSASGLEAGANYLIVAHYDDLGVLAMGYQKANNRHAVVVSENGESITITPGTDPASETEVFQFTLGGSTGAWTLFDAVKGGYLYAASSSSNNLKTQTELDANGEWSITFDAEGTAEVVAQGENTRNYMRFNPNTQNNAPLFSCYSETSTVGALVSLYKSGGGTVTPDPEPSNYPTNFAATVILTVSRDSNAKKSRELHGLTRTLINNMILGVQNEFTKELQINGVGYRVQKQGNNLNLSLGYSHPVIYEAPQGITFDVPNANTIIVKGIDKELVGQIAAEIREKRAPEVYGGKGIKYIYEVIRRKVGKTGK